MRYPERFLTAESGGLTGEVKYINADNVDFIVLDLFCGAGGTTTGFDMSDAKAIVMACINHDYKAIKSHWMNHPEVEHFEEDITKLYGHVVGGMLLYSPEFIRLIRLVDLYRAFYPNAKVILWASLECTNFSKAKGGQPRDADSRTLANHLDRYIHAICPDYIQIENVVEFMSWGPLRIACKKKHKNYSELKMIFNKKTGCEEYAWIPESKKNGQDFQKWKDHVNTFGYRDDWKEINSADFGAYTSRNRLFGCFATNSLPIVWPEATHHKLKLGKGSSYQQGLFGQGLKQWKPVKDVLDFDDEGISIFNRKTPLVDPSLERIYAGLVKFVAGGKDQFLLKYNSTGKDGKHVPPSIDDPCPVIACQDRLGMCFISKYYSGKPDGKVIPVTGPAGTITCTDGQCLVRPEFLINYNHSSVTNSIENPCPTIVCKDKLAIVNPHYIVQRNSSDPNGRVISVDGPARTLTSTGGNQDLVKTCFLATYHGNGDNVSSIDKPAGTIVCGDSFSKIQAIWLDKTYTGELNKQSIEDPAGVIMPNDKHRLIQTCFIDRNFTGGGQNSSIDEPAGAIMAVPKLNLVSVDAQKPQPFILDTNFDNIGRSIDEPCPTIMASRHHHYILNPSHGGHCTSTDMPCPVIVARQDKAPLYVTNVISGLLTTDISSFLSDVDKQMFLDLYFTVDYAGEKNPVKSIQFKIVEFMLLYGISDIKMRMLKVPELLKIQGFPDNYKLFGNQSDQKKFIGNSVHPLVPKYWAEAMAGKLRWLRRNAA